MMKSFFIATFTLLAFTANAVTEQEYLAKNKTYTDGLLAFYAKENIDNKKLATLKADKKTAESELKKATSALASTDKKLAEKQSHLVSLKDKQLNKVQLETDLNNQKQQNLSKINSLNGQISNVNTHLQNVNFEISQLENQKSLIQQKVNTQKQLVNLAEQNVNNIQNDIQHLKQDIQQNKNKIDNLQFDIQILQNQKQLAQDPFEKQQIQNKIDNKKFDIQQLKQDNNFTQNQIGSKEIQLSMEKSQLSQAESQLSSLAIQLNGKQNEINSQVNVQNQLESDLSSLKSQQASLVKKNKNIDAELDVLANLPLHIANTEQEIASLMTLQGQQNVAVGNWQTQLSTVTAALTAHQQMVDTDKANVLASEKDHDAVLKEFLATATVIPVVLGEMPIGIDSITVTETIATSKDWSVIKGSSTTLGVSVCAASTRVLDQTTGVLSELLVVKMINADSSYSSPFVLTTHSMIPDLVVKGQLKTDKSKSILLPILQSPVANEKALLSRYSDSAKLVSSLKADNSAKIEFTIPGSPVTVPFSLKGSSAMINELEDTCKN